MVMHSTEVQTLNEQLRVKENKENVPRPSSKTKVRDGGSGYAIVSVLRFVYRHVHQ